jgi:hypothetical protein
VDQGYVEGWIKDGSKNSGRKVSNCMDRGKPMDSKP